MNSITLQGVTFRWDGDELIITMPRGQARLSGEEAALLFDFLQLHQQNFYAAEQSRGLPAWAREPGRFINGHLSELPSRALEKKKE